MNTPLRALAAAACLLLLSACAPAPAGQGEPFPDGGAVLEVVASTSVYADVAKAVGGPEVNVRAIVDKTSQDPHSYEATARDKLAVSKADVVIANGGGYDPFMDALAQGPARPAGTMIHAVDFQAGHDAPSPATGAAAPTGSTATGDRDRANGNEHVWYDVHTVGALAKALAAEYSKLLPERSKEFTASAAAFEKQVGALAGRTEALRATAGGKKFAMTEPLGFYLLTDAGMADGTPEGISAAMEAGEDVPPLLLNKLAEGLAAHEFAVLALNTQTSGPQSQKVAALAKSAGVPVLELTETLPAGLNYFSWMESNVQQLEVALGR